MTRGTEKKIRQEKTRKEGREGCIYALCLALVYYCLSLGSCLPFDSVKIMMCEKRRKLHLLFIKDK